MSKTKESLYVENKIKEEEQYINEPKDVYEFNEKLHRHKLNGKSLTGVTTVLGVVSKGDGLIQWAANEAVEYVKSHSDSEKKGVDDFWTYSIKESELNNAKTAWKGTRDKAAEQGTDVHAIIEDLVNHAIHSRGKLTVDSHENKQVDNFIKWAITNDVEFLESEIKLYSKELWCGGICDLVFKKGGKLYIGDIKTSKSVYPTYFWQMAAYQFMLKEMGRYDGVFGACVIRVGKDGTFETAENYAYDDNIEGFKAALTVYRKLQAIK